MIVTISNFNKPITQLEQAFESRQLQVQPKQVLNATVTFAFIAGTGSNAVFFGYGLALAFASLVLTLAF